MENYLFTKEGKKEKGTIKHSENNKMTLVSPNLLIITLNVNELNSPSKCIELLSGLHKQDPII